MRFALCMLLVWPLALTGWAEDAGPTNRPTVGLVLGGGGALGLAHIGVLKVLEENRIPIDYIGGTSMGSIIAGFYACGMSPDEMQTFLESLDWNEVMNDETPRRELFFRRKLEDQRYLFELGLSRHGFQMGTGMAAGQKFNNILEYITLRAATVTDFNQLPIPYRAVATDLQSGQPYVMDHGHLATAMRASMAVPGAFTPIEIEGHLLVDGGIVDNLPVDVVKAMGADIIIAVDVGADADQVDPESLKTMGGILGRTYTIAQRPEQMEQFKQADIGIQPVLAGLTAAQFDRVSEFVPKGMEAARSKQSELTRLAVSEEAYAGFLARQRRSNDVNQLVESVRIVGNQRVDEAILRGRIHSETNAPFNRRVVNRDLSRIYGIGEFEQVLFRLQPDSNGVNTLTYDAREKSWGPTYFKYGLNMRSDFEGDAEWAMLLNLTRMSINDLGAEWKNDIELGSSRAIVSEFYQPLDRRGFFFLAPTVDYKAEIQDIYQDDDRIAEYDVSSVESRLDLGVQLRQYAELRVGPMWGQGKAKVQTGALDLPTLNEDYAGWVVGLIVDRQDRTLFAREGYYFQTVGTFAREALGGDRDFDKLTGNFRAQHSVGEHTLSLGVQGGSSLGSELPGYAQFTLGGPFGFAGLAEDQFRGSYLGVASLGHRYRLLALPSQLGRGVYTVARLDVGNVWQDEVDREDVRYGGALGLGADTAIGPLYLAYGLAEGGYGRIYFSLGTAF